jgi:hypothetical protein
MPAVTSVTNFSDGNVLTAAALNAVNCGIHVYADAAARNAAYGGSGERTLVEGEYAYLLDTNQTLVYDGSSWQSVGVAPGLVLITAASFTTVTSVSLAADTFSTTYRNYKIIWQVDSTSANGSTTVRMRAAGADNTTSNYRQMEVGITQANSVTNNAQDNQSTWQGFGQVNSMTFDLLTPKATAYTTLQGIYTDNNTSSMIGRTLNARFVATTSFDSMSFICSSGNFTGFYRVYGWADS